MSSGIVLLESILHFQVLQGLGDTYFFCICICRCVRPVSTPPSPLLEHALNLSVNALTAQTPRRATLTASRDEYHHHQTTTTSGVNSTSRLFPFHPPPRSLVLISVSTDLVFLMSDTCNHHYHRHHHQAPTSLSLPRPPALSVRSCIYLTSHGIDL